MGFRMELNGQPKQINTSNVDRLAREGIVLDSYYVQCVCSPSRVTFLTGRYPLHHGVNDWIPPSSSYGMPLNETTIADHLLAAGYRTHAIGKVGIEGHAPPRLLLAISPCVRWHVVARGFLQGGADSDVQRFSIVLRFLHGRRRLLHPQCRRLRLSA
eukprot:COSAG01_NODE_3100_length_6587_cov_11.955302_3_plen_157_part_00